MRVALLSLVLAAAGCKVVMTPSASLDLGGRTVEPGTGVVEAVAGTPITVRTGWSEPCGGREGVNALGVSPRPSESCNHVRHRVRLRCAEPCRIETPGGGVALGELT